MPQALTQRKRQLPPFPSPLSTAPNTPGVAVLILICSAAMNCSSRLFGEVAVVGREDPPSTSLSSVSAVPVWEGGRMSTPRGGSPGLGGGSVDGLVPLAYRGEGLEQGEDADVHSTWGLEGALGEFPLPEDDPEGSWCSN